MGTKSRDTIYGASVRAAAERAAGARKDADRLACEAWNKRMLGFQGPAQPSPALGDVVWFALNDDRPLSSIATISPSKSVPGSRDSQAPAIPGNWSVNTLPLRDQTVTLVESLPARQR